MKTGHASRNASRFQPGIAENVLFCNVGTAVSGIAGLTGIGGCVVVQAARHKATLMMNASRLVRVNDIEET
ncbi:MAG: hypothetical protein WAN92_04220 [Herbaspirillum sp.]